MNTIAIRVFMLSLMLVLIASACSRAPKPSRTLRLDPNKPQFTLTRLDLAARPAIATFKAPSGEDPTFILHLRLSPAKADAFRQFTRDHKQQQTQLVVGSEVVAEPFVVAEIQDGRVDIDFSSSDEASRVKYLLTKK